MKIKKYIVSLVLLFSVLYGASGINLDKVHETAEQPIIAYIEIGIGE